MDIVTYQREASRTLPTEGVFFGDNVTLSEFMAALYEFQKAAERLDAIKKALFYNRGKLGLTNAYGVETCAALPAKIDKDAQPFVIDVIHMIVGVATEGGEMVEALRRVIGTDNRFDLVNLKEESGDIMWYLANLFNAIDTTFEEVGGDNNGKLRVRFPDKFTTDNANNRNVLAERRALEGRHPHTHLTEGESKAFLNDLGISSPGRPASPGLAEHVDSVGFNDGVAGD